MNEISAIFYRLEESINWSIQWCSVNGVFQFIGYTSCNFPKGMNFLILPYYHMADSSGWCVESKILVSVPVCLPQLYLNLHRGAADMPSTRYENWKCVPSNNCYGQFLRLLKHQKKTNLLPNNVKLALKLTDLLLHAGIVHVNHWTQQLCVRLSAHKLMPRFSDISNKYNSSFTSLNRMKTIIYVRASSFRCQRHEAAGRVVGFTAVLIYSSTASTRMWFRLSDRKSLRVMTRWAGSCLPTWTCDKSFICFPLHLNRFPLGRSWMISCASKKKQKIHFPCCSVLSPRFFLKILNTTTTKTTNKI